MIITIDKHKNLDAVQREFNTVFRFLKIEFQPAGNARDRAKNGATTFADYNADATDLTVTPQTTIAMLKQTLRDAFGVNAQVLRKAGNIWLETSLTESWTLEEQNRQGERLSAK